MPRRPFENRRSSRDCTAYLNNFPREALPVSLNYGLGFVLIHLLHFTVATKQPAMTANAIAASMGDSRGKARDLTYG